MAVSKRLRYEVLRRDNHQCRYCGAAAPDATLTVDHVIPTALGGGDEPGNLVTACMPCNSGKSASVPDAPLVRDVDESALRWSRAMAAAAERMLADLRGRQQIHAEFDQVWSAWTYGTEKRTVPRPADWRGTVDSFIAAGLPKPLLTEAVQLAMGSQKIDVDNKWRYMCGIAWRKVTELQKAARDVADAPGGVVQFRPPSPASRFAEELLDDFFADQKDVLLSRVRASDMESDDEIYQDAVRFAVDDLNSLCVGMERAVDWIIGSLDAEDLDQIRALATAECDFHLGQGQYDPRLVKIRAVFLAGSPEQRRKVATELRLHQEES